MLPRCGGGVGAVPCGGLCGRVLTASPLVARASPMQGATLTPLLGFGFLFGGRSAGEDCDQAVLQFCRHRTGVRNDLWRLDPVTNAWLQVDVGDVKPPPRERHVAGVMDTKLFIFGGKTDPVGLGGGGKFLSDLWRLDPDHPEVTQTLTADSVTNRTHGDAIPEGKFLRRTLQVTTDSSECVSGVQVWVKLVHSCLHNVHISVNGPTIAPYREPATDWPVRYVVVPVCTTLCLTSMPSSVRRAAPARYGTG